MIRTDRLRDAAKAVGTQAVEESLLDLTDELRTGEHQRSVRLDQAGAGADLGIGVIGARNATDAGLNQALFRCLISMPTRGSNFAELGLTCIVADRIL